jgi:hypothetical protein
MLRISKIFKLGFFKLVQIEKKNYKCEGRNYNKRVVELIE